MRNKNSYRTNRALDFDARKNVYSAKNYIRKDYSKELKDMIPKIGLSTNTARQAAYGRGGIFQGGQLAFDVMGVFVKMAEWKVTFQGLQLGTFVSNVRNMFHLFLGTPLHGCSIVNGKSGTRLNIRTNVLKSTFAFRNDEEYQITSIRNLDSGKPEIVPITLDASGNEDIYSFNIEVAPLLNDIDLQNAQEKINKTDQAEEKSFNDLLYNINGYYDPPPDVDHDTLDSARPDKDKYIPNDPKVIP